MVVPKRHGEPEKQSEGCRQGYEISSMPDIHLHSDEVDLVIGGEALRRSCEVVLRIDPRPRLVLKVSGLGTVAAIRAAFGPDTRFSLRIVNAGADCQAFFAGGGDEMAEFTPYTEPIIVGSSANLASVSFDIVNFPSFMVLYGALAGTESNRVDITVAGWHIEIRSPRESPDVEAFQSPIYSVTQSCTLRRIDGATFRSEAALEVLNILHEALSFASGRWVATVFVGGIATGGDVAWKVWGTGKLRPDFSTEGTWFDFHHGDALADVVSGLFDLHRNAENAEAFRTALYWFVRSGTEAAGVDGGLILLQAALERLSWHRFVIDRRMFSAKKFGDLRAHERLRLLVEDCKIPEAVPTGLSKLLPEATKRGWDGPAAVAAARNPLVHPRGLRPLPWYDLWRLARWYVELVLLNMVGFIGEYSNRTLERRWVGAVERVPWA